MAGNGTAVHRDMETAGRAGHWNPHLHIIMTSGGMTPQKRWREVDYFPFTVLHKKWQYHLCTMLNQRGGTRAIKEKIDALWKKPMLLLPRL